MASISVHFQGVQDPHLPLVLIGAVALMLAGWGIWQIVRRQVRVGLISLAAAAGPATFVPTMLICAVVRYLRGDRGGGGGALLAALAATAGTAAAGLLVWAVTGGLWMSILAMEIALAVGVFYSAVYSYLGRRRICGLMALRCLGILALMLILFKPALTLTAGSSGDKPYLPILVDRSGSMGTTDEVNLPDRYRQCLRMLAAQEERIGRHFSPLLFHFATSAHSAESLKSLEELSPSGEGTDGTDLAAAIRAASASYPRRLLAGVLLLTDGIHNSGEVVTDAAIEAGVPIYPVVVGSTSEKLSARRNVELLAVDAPLEAVVNNVTKISVRARVAGFATAQLELQLLEAGTDKPVETQRLWTDQNVATLTAELKWTPKELPGAGAGTAPSGGEAIRKLKVRIPPNPAEASAQDNETELHILLTEPRIRVLYVEGSMRPEYKYLKRLLDSDPNIRFLSLVRITGNRFWSQGQIGDKRLTALPESDEDFALFDVIVLGDLDRTFLKAEQLGRIRRFVNDGGALLMLGGHSSFGPGGYGGTEIEAVLPVAVGPRSQAQETTPFLPQLTAAGEAHPILEGIQGFFAGPGGRKVDEKLPKLPNLLGCVTVADVKPAASLLALHPTRQVDGKPMAVLAVQRFGAGRSAAFTADTTWQWFLPLQGMGRESPYDRFWGQFLRWLANVETKGREIKPCVVMRLDKTYTRVGQEPIKLLARVQDEKGRPPEAAQVSCTLTPVGQAAAPGEKLPLSPRLGDRLFEAELRPPREGKYKVEVTALDAAGLRLGADEQILTVVPFSKEMDRLGRNDALLQMIADRTDGREVDIAGLPDLIDQIVQRQHGSLAGAGPSEQARVVKLFNFPLLFLAFVALLTTEWLLRRRWHLR